MILLSRALLFGCFTSAESLRGASFDSSLTSWGGSASASVSEDAAGATGGLGGFSFGGFSGFTAEALSDLPFFLRIKTTAITVIAIRKTAPPAAPPAIAAILDPAPDPAGFPLISLIDGVTPPGIGVGTAGTGVGEGVAGLTGVGVGDGAGLAVGLDVETGGAIGVASAVGAGFGRP